MEPPITAGSVVRAFFAHMCQWQWPHPIELCHYRSGVAGTGSQQQRRRQQWGNAASEQHLMFAVRPWDPSASRADASHLMPVLTPVRPVQNTSTSVTRSTREVMRQEFWAAHCHLSRHALLPVEAPEAAQTLAELKSLEARMLELMR